MNVGSLLPTIEGLEEYLAVSALKNQPFHETLDAFATKARKGGLSIARMMIGWRLLNPLYLSQSMYWRRDTGVSVERFRHGDAMMSEEFKRSPIAVLIDTEVSEIRCRIDGANAPFEYPVLEELKEAGFTDYYIAKMAFAAPEKIEEPGNGVIQSFVSDRPGGFEDEELAAIQRLSHMLALAHRVEMETDMRRTIAATYLGKVAGARVLSGEIARGEGRHIDAVIWYCDLRGSAALCDALGVDEYLPLLNKYFVATAGAVMREGGDVLDFIGDAVLAIFPLHEDGARRALRATKAAALEVEALRRTEPAFRGRTKLSDVTGIAVATGSVVYGNIGVPERLTFSVIGPTVNAVARLEDLTKVIGEPVLATGDIVRQLEGHLPFRALGAYRLPGQSEAQEIYAPQFLRDQAPAGPDAVSAV